MNGRAVVLIVVGVAGCLLSQGCASRVRDPATGTEATYHWEALCAEVDRSTWDVYAAAQQAVDELELKVWREEVDGLAGDIRAVDAHFNTVEIQLGAMPGCRTRLTIRIDLFGDKDKSIVLFEEIMAKLGEQESPTSVPRPR